MQDSFTSTSLFRILQSAAIWSPVFKMIISSKTNWWISIFSFLLFLITVAFGDVTIDNLSTTFFEWISWIVLIAVFIITMSKNSMFLYEPTKNIHSPNTRFIRLNNVKKFSYNIFFMLFVGTVVSWFTRFSSILFWTCSAVSPVSVFASYLSIFFKFITFLLHIKL